MFQHIVLNFNFVSKRFAGHSKWANIRHIKGAKDAERSNLFNKLARQIKVAVAEGGSADPKKNLSLSQIISQCHRFNMPSATLASVLKSCEQDKSSSASYILDIKGPGNCMIICELFTSNLHHTKQTMTTILKKNKSKFSEGSGLHLFDKKGVIQAENINLSSKPKEEQLELATDHAIESNAEEVTLVEDNIFEFICSKDNFQKTQNCLEKLGYKIVNASVDYIPLKMQEIGSSDFESYEKLILKLEEMPEVVRLFDNTVTS